MSNPAAELADLLVDWHVENGGVPSQVRTAASQAEPGSIEFWRHVGRATVLLREIEVRLDQMRLLGRNVDHYRRLLAPCYRAVYMPDTTWGSSSTVNPNDRLSESQLDTLRALGDVLAGLDTEDHMPEQRVDRIRESLLALLLEIDELAETPERDRLRWHVEQALFFAVNYEQFGAASVAATATQVIADTQRLLAQADGVDDERRDRIRRLMRDIGINLFSSAVFQVGVKAIEGPGGDVIRAITSG